MEGLVEGDADRLLEVLAAVRAFAPGLAPGLEDAGEDVLEAGAAHAHLRREIEPLETDLGHRGLRERGLNAHRERIWFSPHCLKPNDGLFAALETSGIGAVP